MLLLLLLLLFIRPLVKFIFRHFIKQNSLHCLLSHLNALLLKYRSATAHRLPGVSLFLGWMEHANKFKKNRQHYTFSIDFIALYCFNCVFNKFSNHIACTHNIQMKYFVCDKQSKCRLWAVRWNCFKWNLHCNRSSLRLRLWHFVHTVVIDWMWSTNN